MTETEFIENIKQLGIKYTPEMIEQLRFYCDYLLEYNKHTNLTAIREEKDVYLKHFYDSLTLVKAVDLIKFNNVLDIGSGAGFPGIVLKIFYPHLNVTLIDSNNKKTSFLQTLVDKLGLININIVNDRVEKFAQHYLNYFDLVTARAVTNMPVLSELALPLVKDNGIFIAMKGKVEEELKKAIDAISIMGGEIINSIYFDLCSNGGERSLIVIKKVRETNLKELRPYEKIIKKPLQKNRK